MTSGKALDGKPYAGNPHVRLDEGEIASAVTPRVVSLLCSGLKIFDGKTTLALAFIGAALCASAVPTVTIDSVTQRWPWNNKVDIKYTISGGTDMSKFEYYKIKFNATINGQAYEIDGSKDLIAKTVDGTHTVTWTNAPAGVRATGCTMGATLYETTGDYMIVDLDTGHFAFENLETGDTRTATPTESNARYNTALYKTDRLVMRRVERTTAPNAAYASYRTGYSDYQAPTYTGSYTNTPKDWVTSKDYYAGVFMVTFAQYRKLMGSTPWSAPVATYGNNVEDWCPVGAPAYNKLRNSKSATTALSSDATSVSFFERLNAKTGILGFDLPTEVMWEIAHRAGTTTMYPWRDGYNYNDNAYRIHCNDTRTKSGGKTQIFRVGAYMSTQWGLYDTMGQLAEFCRDVGRYGDLAEAPDPWTPQDIAEGSVMFRGNYWEVSLGNNGFKASYRQPSWSVADDTSMLGTQGVGRYIGFRVFFVAQ